MKKIWTTAGTFVVFFSALAMAQERTELKGLITARDGDTMTIQTSDGEKHPVLLSDDTKIRTPKGLGLRKEKMSWTSLIPGLPVKVKGLPDPKGQLAADEVSFSKDDLQTASMIQAGLAPTKTQVEANQTNIATNQQNIAANQQQITENMRKTEDRFDSSADYDVRGQMTIYFPSGSAVISEKDKATLAQKATKVTPLKGYIIEVKGFADSSGNAAMNQTLSRKRAEAVVDYLMQSCNISPRHILAPGAMGISNPAASNENSAGRKDNRRVEIKLLVNKGIGSAGAD